MGPCMAVAPTVQHARDPLCATGLTYYIHTKNSLYTIQWYICNAPRIIYTQKILSLSLYIYISFNGTYVMSINSDVTHGIFPFMNERETWALPVLLGCACAFSSCPVCIPTKKDGAPPARNEGISSAHVNLFQLLYLSGNLSTSKFNFRGRVFPNLPPLSWTAQMIVQPISSGSTQILPTMHYI